MAYIMKTGSPFLYDEVTGDIVGIKDKDGSEKYFPVVSSAAPDDNDGRPDGTIYIQTAA